MKKKIEIHNKVEQNKNNIPKDKTKYDSKLSQMENKNMRFDVIAGIPIIEYDWEQCDMFVDVVGRWKGQQYKGWELYFERIHKKYLPCIKVEILIGGDTILLLSRKTRFFEIIKEDGNFYTGKLHFGINFQVFQDPETAEEAEGGGWVGADIYEPYEELLYNYINDKSPVFVKPIVYFFPPKLFYKEANNFTGENEDTTFWDYNTSSLPTRLGLKIGDRYLATGDKRPDPTGGDDVPAG